MSLLFYNIIVEFNDENACSTSKEVNVSTVSENAHKGKNVPDLSDKMVLSETSCPLTRKQDSKNHEYDQASELPQVEVPSIAMRDKCTSQDSIGDTNNYALCEVDKYSLEMSSTAKSYGRLEGPKKIKIYWHRTNRCLVLWVTKPCS